MGIEWFRCAVIYHILIDRFAGFKVSGIDAGRPAENCSQKPEFCGGTLRGIIEKLPYIKDLGADALLLSPFYRTTAYHGYHITDFFSVEPRFGTEADLRELVRAAHGMGLRVLIDFVPNHCSQEHPFFIDAKADKASDYHSWFYFTHWPDRYLCFLDVAELPKINLDYPPARRHMIDAALHWLGLGVDGFRIDHAIGPSLDFYREFMKEAKNKNPDAAIFGEAWFSHPPLRLLPTVAIPRKYFHYTTHTLTQERVQRVYARVLDGALDFAARELFVRSIARKSEPQEDTAGFIHALGRHYKKYPASSMLPVFLDNHDTNRFLFECGNDRKRLMRALALLFGIDQPVILYYGTETGLSQDKAPAKEVPFSDLQARRPMNWDSSDSELREFVKMLIKTRKERGRKTN